MKKNEIQKNENSIVLYQNEDSNVCVTVFYGNETFWLSQKALAELFGCSSDNISLHLKKIYFEGELEEKATTEFFSVVQKEGTREVSRNVKFYNLDAVIAVGYRVNSHQATAFRIWATKTLKEYITKGFVLNDDMLKNGQPFGKDYFDELLERIREIRASERRAYQKIADVFEQCSYDYDKKSETTKAFYSFVQNKLHYAAHGHTAAEVIYERADATKPFMGLTTFAGELPALKDIGIAKNYLSESELKILNNLVSGYFDLAEISAIEHKPMYMSDYIRQLDSILTSGNRPILEGLGSVSHAQALDKATTEYRKYQNNTLSPVEEAYLETIKATAKLVKKNTNAKKN